MVLIALAEIGVRVTWWTVKGVFSIGKYLIYGREKTDQEKIAELENKLKEVEEKLEEKLKEVGDGKLSEDDIVEDIVCDGKLAEDIVVDGKLSED